MKKSIFLLIPFIWSAYITLGQSISQQQLSTAIYEEEVSGDLEKAIQLYGKIVETFPNDRNVVAEALVRMGIVNEKLGSKKARKYYEDVVKNYGDQKQHAETARMRLRALASFLQHTVEPEPSVTMKKLYSTVVFFGDISPDQRYVTNVNWATANIDYIDLVTGEEKPVTTNGTWMAPPKWPDESVWTPDGKSVIFGWSEMKEDDKEVHYLRKWEMESGKIETIYETEEFFLGPIQITKDNKVLTYLFIKPKPYMHGIGLFDLKTGVHEILIRNSRENLNWQGANSTPDGKFLVYSKKSERGDFDIYLFNTEQKTEYLISGHVSEENMPIWSKNGKYVFFVSDRSGNNRIYKLEINEGSVVGNPKLVFSNVGERCRLRSFLSNGELVFSNRAGYSDIFIGDVDLAKGTIHNTEILIPESGEYINPEWSHDGNSIAILKRNALVIKNIKTGVDKLISLKGKKHEIKGHLRWSRDDSEVLIENQQGGLNLVVVDIENETMEFIENIGRPAVFGPDHSIIASKWTESPCIIKMDLKSKKIDTLLFLEPEHDEKVVFGLEISPDLKHLIVLEGRGNSGVSDSIRIINLETHQSKTLWDFDQMRPFSFGLARCLNDNQHFVIAHTFQKENDFEKMQWIKINIHTGIVEHIGPMLDEPHVRRGYDLNPAGDKIVYKKSTGVEEIWSLRLKLE